MGFKIFWSLILKKTFSRTSVAGSGEMRLGHIVLSQLSPHFCCCADHCQLSCVIKWGWLPLCLMEWESQSFNVFIVSKWVHILLKLNFHAFDSIYIQVTVKHNFCYTYSRRVMLFELLVSVNPRPSFRLFTLRTF